MLLESIPRRLERRSGQSQRCLALDRISACRLSRHFKPDRLTDFWANGMAAELAVRHGVGTVVLDVRRGDGPAGCFGYTFASVAASDAALASRPTVGAAVKRAIGRAHDLLRKDIGLAMKIGSRLFPTEEASLIESLIARDLPWYETEIHIGDFAAINSVLDKLGC